MASRDRRRTQTAGPWLIIFAIVVVVVCGALLWRRLGPAVSGPASAGTASVPGAASSLLPAVQHPLAAAPAAAGSGGASVQPLQHPSADEALASLRALFGGAWLDQLLIAGDLIPRAVMVIDALPRQVVPVFALPLHAPTGAVQTQSGPGGVVLAAANAERYSRYMQVLEQADPHAVVVWYLRHYDLFQQAYRDLGDPHAYFNDRLIVVIDDLLAAPSPSGPIALLSVPPYYHYANPQWQALSAGQRWMMRLGPMDEARLKAKLQAIRAQLVAAGRPGA